MTSSAPGQTVSAPAALPSGLTDGYGEEEELEDESSGDFEHYPTMEAGDNGGLSDDDEGEGEYRLHRVVAEHGDVTAVLVSDPALDKKDHWGQASVFVLSFILWHLDIECPLTLCLALMALV